MFIATADQTTDPSSGGAKCDSRLDISLRSLARHVGLLVYKHSVPYGTKALSCKLFCYHVLEQHTNGAPPNFELFLTLRFFFAACCLCVNCSHQEANLTQRREGAKTRKAKLSTPQL